jgi:hypothetical protein
MATTTVVLEIVASRTVYSLFANVINWVLLGAFLVGEYRYRRIRFPSYQHKPPYAILGRFGSGVLPPRQRDAT